LKTAAPSLDAAIADSDVGRVGVKSLAFVLAHHRNLMLGFTAAVAAAAMTTAGPSAPVQMVILAVAVVCVGLPHGALDHLVGRQLLQPLFPRMWWIVFGGTYVALGLAVAVIWILVPPLALAGFLLLSAAHFGWDDPSWIPTNRGLWSALERFSVGALPIVLPMVAFPGDVATVFGWLMPKTSQIAASTVAISGWIAVIAVTPIAAFRALRLAGGGAAHQAAAAELAAIAVLHVVAPPLIAFLVYFCGWHSIRHALELSHQLAPGRPAIGLRLFVRRALPMTALAVLAAVIVAPVVGATALDMTEVLATLIFIGLSVLTVPHMATMALGRRLETAPPGPAGRKVALGLLNRAEGRSHDRRMT
jgi:Brp/Blh family beta-carotene 15,15'-monooxygenase